MGSFTQARQLMLESSLPGITYDASGELLSAAPQQESSAQGT